VALPTFLQDVLSSTVKGSRNNWARNVKFALKHPDGLPMKYQLLTVSSCPQQWIEDYEKACEQRHQVDQQIAPDVIKNTVQLFFSTNLPPEYDLSTCQVRKFLSTNMLALIMP
jgi:hypothetical protein